MPRSGRAPDGTGPPRLAAVPVAVAFVVLLRPLHVNGVSGSALVPHYGRFFVFSTAGPLPDRPTPDDLRRAGVVLPTDVVAGERHVANWWFGVGVLLVVAGWALIVRARRRPTTDVSATAS